MKRISSDAWTPLALLFFFAFVGINLVAHADTFAVPTLRAHPYATLRFPPTLTRERTQWMVQRTVDELYHVAFVDLGHMSDYMHMHVILQSNTNLPAPPLQLTDPHWLPDWTQYTMPAALLHTQEYNFLRDGAPYEGPSGPLESRSRNQLLFLEDNASARAGEVRSAREFVRAAVRESYTIRSGDVELDSHAHELQTNEFSFYFFRVNCSDVNVIRALESGFTNVIEVRLGPVKACLALMSMYCRNHSNDSTFCSEGKLLTPDTTIEKH